MILVRVSDVEMEEAGEGGDGEDPSGFHRGGPGRVSV